jgi:hypothetical protein
LQQQPHLPSRAKRSRKVRPVLNASVASSLFGDSGRQVTLKQQLRSARRLLQRSASLPADVRSRKEAEVKILTDQLAEKQKRDRLQRIDAKYKMVKFIGQTASRQADSEHPLQAEEQQH